MVWYWLLLMMAIVAFSIGFIVGCVFAASKEG